MKLNNGNVRMQNGIQSRILIKLSFVKISLFFKVTIHFYLKLLHSQEQQDCESETGDWEMMKFTPEVIINEGDSNSDEIKEVSVQLKSSFFVQQSNRIIFLEGTEHQCLTI